MNGALEEFERRCRDCAACEDAGQYYRHREQPVDSPGVDHTVPPDFARDKLRHDEDEHDERLHELARALGWSR